MSFLSPSPLKATFWGTGTSTGVPMVGCDCSVCRSTDTRNRRRRASLLIEDAGRRWLIDAGPDFRVQALDARIDSLEGVMLTHAHADHILGLDDLRPLSWKHEISVWADGATEAAVRQAFPYFFQPGDGKTSRPQLRFRRLTASEPIDLGGLEVLPLDICHGDARILGFRIGTLAYLTDCNGIPEATRPLLADLDVLVLGALRAKPHATHYSLDEARDEALVLGARQTYFTHFSHDVDHAVLAASLPAGMAPAHDGLSFEFHR
jgi:phosphoribosyl 1,2-cyclic phosphodiesterase